MRHVPAVDLPDRFAEWSRRYERTDARRIRALDLYAGDHWATIRNIATKHRPLNVEVWICSAGVGLVNGETRLAPYAATFSRNHVDAVSKAGAKRDFTAELQQWWRCQTEWKMTGDQLRSITDLVAARPDSIFTIVAAGGYLDAISQDLKTARAAANDRIALFSADAASRPEFKDVAMPINADLAGNLGGSLHALNARSLDEALGSLKDSRLTIENLRRNLEERMADAQPRERFNRNAMSDDEVRQFIRERLNHDEKAAKTVLLRALRDSGRACEQNRFSRLYQEVKNSGK